MRGLEELSRFIEMWGGEASSPSYSGCACTDGIYYRDEYCPNCDNHFVLDAVTPRAALKVESDDTRMDSRMLKDDRVKQNEIKSIWDVGEHQGTVGKLG